MFENVICRYCYEWKFAKRATSCNGNLLQECVRIYAPDCKTVTWTENHKSRSRRCLSAIVCHRNPCANLSLLILFQNVSKIGTQTQESCELFNMTNWRVPESPNNSEHHKWKRFCEKVLVKRLKYKNPRFFKVMYSKLCVFTLEKVFAIFGTRRQISKKGLKFLSGLCIIQVSMPLLQCV